jgi:hypothetical protein
MRGLRGPDPVLAMQYVVVVNPRRNKKLPKPDNSSKVTLPGD